MWCGGMKSLVGDFDLNLMWLVFLASFYSCGCLCHWDSDVLGKKHRRNWDAMRTETWLERGLGKENRRNKKKKRVRRKLGSGLEYGLNLDWNID
jgi:hypothetical protein